MGVLTLNSGTLNFRTELLLALFDRNDLGAVPTARLDNWINWAYRHVSYPSVFAHVELETNYDITLTNAGTYTLATPAGPPFRINGVKNVTHYEATPAAVTDFTRKDKLRPRPISWFDQRTLIAGKPSRYAIYGETLFIDAPPSTTYQGQLLRVRCFREVTALVNDTDTTVLPAIWDETILLGARWRAERDLGYGERAELTKQNYAALLNEYREQREYDARDTEWLPGIELGNSVMG